jgi:cell division protein FtsQ
MHWWSVSSRAQSWGNSLAKIKPNLTTRQKESKKINRKRAVRQWWKTTTRRVMLSILTVIAVCGTIGGCWLWHAGKAEQALASIHDRFWQKTANLGFKVKNVYLEGRKYTPLSDITLAMNIHTGDPILALSLDGIRTKLEAIPRVKYAEVARVLPDQLHIHLTEREPVAIWQNKGKLHLIDSDGVAMEYIDPAQHKELLLVVGDDAPAHAHELFSMLALEPEMGKSVIAAQRVGERRWNLRFKNGMELKLPEKNANAAWQGFAAMERDNHVMERQLKSVDMRLSDRIFIKSSPVEVSPTKPGGRET